METKSFKASLIDAVNALNLDQVDQVVAFIHELKHTPSTDSFSRQSREKAMNQIREALQGEQQPRVFELETV